MLLELAAVVVILGGACACIAWRLVRRRRMGNEGSAEETARIRAILAELAAARAEAAGPKRTSPPHRAPETAEGLQQAEIRAVQDPADGQPPAPAEAAPMEDSYGKKVAVAQHLETVDGAVATARAEQPIQTAPRA